MRHQDTHGYPGYGGGASPPEKYSAGGGFAVAGGC